MRNVTKNVTSNMNHLCTVLPPDVVEDFEEVEVPAEEAQVDSDDNEADAEELKKLDDDLLRQVSSLHLWVIWTACRASAGELEMLNDVFNICG